jgi:hypothetical protein
MQNGAPFSKDDRGEYYIEGFDIDNNENFYFLGGRKANLACFTSTGKSVYRKALGDYVPGEMTIVGSKLYFFEIGSKSLNTLVEVDKANGSVIRDYPKTIANALKARGYQQIDYYEYRDSLLKIHYIDSEGIEKTKTICFDLKAEPADCSGHSPAAIENEKDYENLGRLGKYYVLGRYNDDGTKYELTLRDSSYARIADSYVDRKWLGAPLCGVSCMPQEHRKVRNNKLYMLNRDKNMAEITVIDLKTLFHFGG